MYVFFVKKTALNLKAFYSCFAQQKQDEAMYRSGLKRGLDATRQLPH